MSSMESASSRFSRVFSSSSVSSRLASDTSELGLQFVDAGVADAMLAAKIGDRHAGLMLLQNPDDLFLRKAAALHALVLVVGQNELQTGLSPRGKVSVKGQNSGGVYAFNVPRRDPISQGGMELTPVGPMGVAMGINFQPTGGGKAVITGDFVLSGDEVNPVITALRSNGIEVTALHSHMLDEQPRLFFMHFWANDDAMKLARGLRAALDKTATTKD
jgi:hypothetical protein